MGIIKSCVLDSWDFFSENSTGAANKVLGNKITGIKVPKKINLKKQLREKVWGKCDQV